MTLNTSKTYAVNIQTVRVDEGICYYDTLTCSLIWCRILFFLLYCKTAGNNKYFISGAGSIKYNAEMYLTGVYLTRVISQAVTTNTH